MIAVLIGGAFVAGFGLGVSCAWAHWRSNVLLMRKEVGRLDDALCDAIGAPRADRSTLGVVTNSPAFKS